MDAAVDGTLTADRITDLIAEAARAQSIATSACPTRQHPADDQHRVAVALRRPICPLPVDSGDERSAAYQCALLVPMDTTMIGATDDQSHRRKV